MTTLLPLPEKALRLLLLGIVRGNPDAEGRSEQLRVAQALAPLLGRKTPRGAPPKNRDDLLELLAYNYASFNKDPDAEARSATEVAREVVENHPNYWGRAGNDVIVDDIVRQFQEHKADLVAAYGPVGHVDFDQYYGPIGEALTSLAQMGVSVDWSAMPD